ncbi:MULTISPECIES: trypco2 family protein [Streptomyces]|uniref:Trypco2 family protein n=2 Tax=Streptomyces eurythermus TaxID=42237 RepID=A0ABW6YQD8_9ACTN|nr:MULTISPECIES: trypco2 family protein [Streptomyces]
MIRSEAARSLRQVRARGYRMAEIGLAAAIEELRQELYAAQGASVGQQFAFEIEDAQLELLLELRNEGRGEGKLTFGVATVGAGGSTGSTRTHKLTLTLKVKDRATGGGRAEVSADETGSWGED